MRRMLDPKEVGGGGSLPSTIQFDEEGNRIVGKNIKIDGKMQFSSLVSGQRPTGEYPIINTNVVLGSYYKYSTTDTLLYPTFGYEDRVYINGKYAKAFNMTTFRKDGSEYKGSLHYLQLLLWLHVITITSTNMMYLPLS